MSDLPDKQHPWAKFHAKKGVEVPRAGTPALRSRAKLPESAVPTAATKLTPGEPVATPQPGLNLAPESGPKPEPTPKPKVVSKKMPRAPAAKVVVKLTPRPVVEQSAFTPIAKSLPSESPTAQTADKPAALQDSPVSDDLASALASLAKEYAPVAAGSMPFLSVKDKEAEVRALRRKAMRKLGKIVLWVLGGLVISYFLIGFLFYRRPSDDELQAAVNETAKAVLLLETNELCPLAIESAEPILREIMDSRHVRYYAEITLRLRQSLYSPTQSNGTVVYDMLRESLRLAESQELKFNFFALGAGPKPPVLPRLIQLVHRVGERMVVRVPIETERFGWRWRLKPGSLANRAVNRTFSGEILDAFDDVPYLIFGLPSTMPDIRARTKAAQEFITAVAREIQKHADVEAVAAPDEAAVPALVTGAESATVNGLPFDPDKPAVLPGTSAKPGQAPPGLP